MQRRIIPLLFLTLTLTGCYLDPYRNPGSWSMTAAQQHNLAVQAADPSDLIQGRSNPLSSGVAASAGVDKALGGPAGTAAGLQAQPTAPSINITGS